MYILRCKKRTTHIFHASAHAHCPFRLISLCVTLIANEKCKCRAREHFIKTRPPTDSFLAARGLTIFAPISKSKILSLKAHFLYANETIHQMYTKAAFCDCWAVDWLGLAVNVCVCALANSLSTLGANH